MRLEGKFLYKVLGFRIVNKHFLLIFGINLQSQNSTSLKFNSFPCETKLIRMSYAD